MSGVSGTISKILDFFTNGYETSDDPFDKLAEEVGASYPVEDNTAKSPEYTTAPFKKQAPKTRDNVVAYPSRGNELIITEPRSFSEDSMQIIRNLQEGKTIILNLHLLDKDNAQRMVDFVSGATQALNGHQQKIDGTSFLFAPANISISTDTMKSKTSMSDGIWGQRQY